MTKQKRPELHSVELRDSFFSPILERISRVTIPDILEKFEHDRGGAIDNFDRVRDGRTGEHAGPEWYDGLTYETMTGISDFLVHHYDRVTDLHMDNYAARIAAAAARDEDGYINTYTQTMEPEHRFGENGGFLRGQHDVYNAGCLVEAGVHHYIAMGKTSVLDSAVKFACYLCDLIGPKPKKNIVPAHSLPEEAFVELYRLFQKDERVRARYPEAGDGHRFLELAEFWIENRGNHCGLPDWENWKYEESLSYIKECKYGNERPSWGEYAQDKVSVFEQESIAGHAVRAVLLFTGIAACAYETDRQDYLRTAERIWENMANKRIHITGGVGAIHNDEKFGADYYLPHDAYLETCAAVGVIFFSHAMYLLSGDAKYMDCLETSLYNGALAGISHNGTRYSYINPLISDGSLHRWDWHVCPCCPPMDLKLYGRLPQFAYSFTDDSVSVNLFLGSKASIPMPAGNLDLIQTGNYPWGGAQKIAFGTGYPEAISLRIRIPGWCKSYSVLLNGKPAEPEYCCGYAVVRQRFNKGDVVEVLFDMPVLKGQPNPKVSECKGQVALRRGPVIYCVEEADNAQGLDFVIDNETKLSATHDYNFLGGATVLEGFAGGKPIKAVPFYLWDNRAPGKMSVWLKSGFDEGDERTDALYSFSQI